MTHFLVYLTVFRSRLGLVNIVLSVTGLSHQSEATVQRKIRQITERKVEVPLGEPNSERVFQYLADKRLISEQARAKGRYRSHSLTREGERWIGRNRDGSPLSTLPVYQTDIWMADPALRSTIGVPTPENAAETLDLAIQLGAVSRAKHTWTSAGHLISALRQATQGPDGADQNPFLVRLEAPVLLRQVIDADGFVLIELLRMLADGRESITRDEVAQRFDEVVAAAFQRLRGARIDPRELRKVQKFLDNVRVLVNRQTGASGAPGVLEHRVSPRLEWLADLGYLSKEGLPKNGFDYRVNRLDVIRLLDRLEASLESRYWGESVALQEWLDHPAWAQIRESVMEKSGTDRFRYAYQILRRRIGPSPIREVAFASGLFSRRATGFEELVEELSEFARATPGASLSGGRYGKTPENIYLTDEALKSN